MIDRIGPYSRGQDGERVRGPSVGAVGDILLVFAPLALLAIAGNSVGLETMAGGLLLNVGFVLSVLVGHYVLQWRGTSWWQIGLSAPRSWPRTVGLAFGALLGALAVQVVVQLLLQALPGLTLPPPDVSRFNPIAGNVPLFVLMLVLAWTTIAFGEEMVYRAFLIGRLTDLFQGARWASALAVLGSGAIFGLAHFAEGPTGVASNGAFGLLFGAIYVRTGRNLWVTIIAHGLLNTLRFTLLFVQGA